MAPVDPAENGAVSGAEIFHRNVTVGAAERCVLSTDRRSGVGPDPRLDADTSLGVSSTDLNSLAFVKEKPELLGAMEKHDELSGRGTSLAERQWNFAARAHEQLGLIVETRELRKAVGPELSKETPVVVAAEVRLGGTADDALPTKAAGLELYALLLPRQPLMRMHPHVSANHTERVGRRRFPTEKAVC